MKTYYFLIILISIFSCSKTIKKNAAKKEANQQHQIVNFKFQTILDSAKVNGSIVIYDAQKEIYYSNDFTWARKGKIPASTFKIPNSIIALELGVVANDSALFKWDQKARYLKIWEQDLFFRDAFKFSCVPCYQEVAREIGERRMNNYLDKFDFGNMKVDSTNIDVFWLEGDSQINQFQQIDFLKRFYNRELPISNRTQKIMKKIMIKDQNDKYTLSGKTGLSIRNDNRNGWFVGYVEAKNNVYFFATNVEPQKQIDNKLFLKTRIKTTYQALKQLDIIK